MTEQPMPTPGDTIDDVLRVYRGWRVKEWTGVSLRGGEQEIRLALVRDAR